MGYPRVIETFDELKDFARPGLLIGMDWHIIQPQDEEVQTYWLQTDYGQVIELQRTGPVHWRITQIRDLETGSEIQVDAQDKEN